MVGRPAPDWRTPRVQAEIGGQLAPIAEAADFADGDHERRRDDHVDAGDAHQPLDLGPAQRVGGDQLVDLRDLCLLEVDLAQAGVDGLALADREPLDGQPPPSLDAEEVRCGGRSFRPRIDTAWISFLTRERARTSCARRARRRRITRTAHRAPRPRRARPAQQLGQPSRIEPVGLGPGLADAVSFARRRSPARRVAPGSARSPTHCRHLQRDPVARVQALREQLQRLGPRLIRPAERTRPSATIATSQKSR